jgi:Zn-dependent protease with chaperone function
MNNAGRMFGILAAVLAIPLIAFLASAGIQWKLDSTLREAMLKEFPDRAAVIADISVGTVCENLDLSRNRAFEEVCATNSNLELMKSGALLGAVIAIVLLGAIKLAGKLARKRRRLLLLFFAPGLHLTMLIVSGLMILYAVLGIAAIYYGESVLFGRIHVGIMLGLGLGAILGVFAVIRAQFSAVRRASTTALGKKLDREHYSSLWSFIDKLADGMGAQRPESIVAGLDPNFYVTEADVACLDGKLQGRTMYISLPLCRIFSVDELKAVLGHELGHYKGFDTRFSQRFYPIYRGASQAVVHLGSAASEKGSAGDAILLPAFVTLSYFLDSFSKAESEISRERELTADREAAVVAGNRSIASALVKIHAFSPIWPVIRNHMKDIIAQGKMLTNASAVFVSVVSQAASGDALTGVSEEGPSHPTDTHPPLSVRLKNVCVGIEEVLPDAAVTAPEPSAIALIDNADAVEAELTDILQALMVRTGEACPPSDSSTAAAASA